MARTPDSVSRLPSPSHACLYAREPLDPRIFIAATRMNEGKTTLSLGLISALRARSQRIGYIKPVGQRFVEVDGHKIDEDSVLIDRVFGGGDPLAEMSPVAVEPEFTRKDLQSGNHEALAPTITRAFDRIARGKDFVVVEGTGHAGVGSVFDLSNATVATLLGATVLLFPRVEVAVRSTKWLLIAHSSIKWEWSWSASL